MENHVKKLTVVSSKHHHVQIMENVMTMSQDPYILASTALVMNSSQEASVANVFLASQDLTVLLILMNVIRLQIFVIMDNVSTQKVVFFVIVL